MSDDVSWVTPLPGTWLRNFRLGEWLPEPLTPLFETWVLERLETSCFKGMVADGVARHVTVNGWYFHAPGGPRQLLRLARRHPLGLVMNFGLARWRPDLTDRWVITPAAREWEHVLLPRYRQLVDRGWERVGDASAPELIALIDEVAATAGEYFASITRVAGFAWKAEWALARFYRRRLLPLVGDTHQSLLSGISATPLVVPAHAVHSLDWVRPTLGEQAFTETHAAASYTTDRQAVLHAAREHAETACRRALAGRRRRRRQFERLVDVARRSALRRETQVGDFTLGWPLLRSAVLRLGALAADSGGLDTPEDVFFLTRGELEALLDPPGSGTDHRAAVRDRRNQWHSQCRLTPPLRIGPPTPADRIANQWHTADQNEPRPAVVVGLPASPGSASGPVRIILGPEDFDRVHQGDVLVAPLTTPAWTTLFHLAAAVVIEGGNVLAHASLIAREFGLPAVVAAPNATLLLHDGELVTVDGSTGTITINPGPA